MAAAATKHSNNNDIATIIETKWIKLEKCNQNEEVEIDPQTIGIYAKRKRLDARRDVIGNAPESDAPKVSPFDMLPFEILCMILDFDKNNLKYSDILKLRQTCFRLRQQVDNFLTTCRKCCMCDCYARESFASLEKPRGLLLTFKSGKRSRQSGIRFGYNNGTQFYFFHNSRQRPMAVDLYGKEKLGYYHIHASCIARFTDMLYATLPDLFKHGIESIMYSQYPLPLMREPDGVRFDLQNKRLVFDRKVFDAVCYSCGSTIDGPDRFCMAHWFSVSQVPVSGIAYNSPEEYIAAISSVANSAIVRLYPDTPDGQRYRLLYHRPTAGIKTTTTQVPSSSSSCKGDMWICALVCTSSECRHGSSTHTARYDEMKVKLECMFRIRQQSMSGYMLSIDDVALMLERTQMDKDIRRLYLFTRYIR